MSFLINPFTSGAGGGAVEVVAQGDLAQWLAAFKESYSDGDRIASYTDWSGNARHMTQSNSSNKPEFKTNVLNSKPGVRFDGAAYYLECTAFMSGEAEMMAIMKVPDSSTGSNYGAYKFDGQTNACHFPFFLSTVYTAFGNNARNSYTFSNNNIPVNGMLHHVQVKSGTNNWKVWENGGPDSAYKIRVTPTITWSGGSGPKHLLGASSSNANGSSPGPFFRGHFLEWIIWNRILTDAERNAQLALFTTRYGLTLTNF